MMGHSLGEYVAACLAGVFTRDDALALVARAGEADAGPALGCDARRPRGGRRDRPFAVGPSVSIAGYNAPS